MKIKRILFIAAAVFTTIFIFSNSMKTAEVSSQSSGRFVDIAANILAFFGIKGCEDILVVPVRKSAHVAEFVLQGVLVCGCFDRKYSKRIIYILFFGLMTACIDEYIQLFVDGRAGMVQDIFIDFAGTCIAVFLTGISRSIRR